MRLLILLIAVLLHACATPIGQSIVNPNVTEAEWKAEQQYFVEQIETFCFDRAWDVNPLSFSQDRPLHGSKNYNLWGRITDDMTGDYTSDFHYVCHLTANIPMNTTIGLNDPVYHVRRSSPWAYSNRRQSFHQLLQNRYGALETKLSASTSSHKISPGIAMLLRDGETQINVEYFEKNSGVRLRVYRRQLFEGNESNLSEHPPGSTTVSSYEVSRTLFDHSEGKANFIKFEAPVNPINLVDILSFDQMSEDQLNTLQLARDKLSEADKSRLFYQTMYNSYRFTTEMNNRQNYSNKLNQYAREEAAFMRQLAEREAAANRAIFANIASSLQSQTPSRSSSFNTSTSSQPQTEANGSFNSSLAPWGNINAEAARAKQMKQDQFNSSQAKPNSVFITQSNRQLPVSNQLADQNKADVTSTASESKSKSKVYEPMPEKAQKTTDTWFSSQSQALAYARLKAANQVTSICRGKGAQTDSITFKEIEAGIAPSRWNYSAPDCRQGGFSDKEWKCEATVSAPCYRMR